MSGVGPVQVHLHHTMTGTYPLRVLDVLFCAERVVAVEYAYATPVDLATGSVRRHADAFAATLREEGLEAALASAEHQRTVSYADLDGVTVYGGGVVGREKVTFDAAADADAPPAVRVHGDLDVDAFVDALRAVFEPHGTAVDRERGIGIW